MTTNYTLLTSNTTYTAVLTSADGPGRVSAIGGHAEWRVGTSAPSVSLRGEPLRGTLYDPDSTETLLGDTLVLEEGLTSGTTLYMRPIDKTVEVVVNTAAEMFGA
jgi:hypothetical protein